jgi:hypothetical protein
MRYVSSYLCISDADVLTPLQSNKTIPAKAKHSRNRVRVRNTHIALVGGRLAFADFHVTPPFGSNIFDVDRGLGWTLSTTSLRDAINSIWEKEAPGGGWIVFGFVRKTRSEGGR